ncbi:MAG: toprim domain-containing protein [Mycoplasma sp.]|nr:toprim domain-containing protein [Mycoplasma sp.]
MIKIINIETRDVFHIDLHKKGGEEQLLCPECSAARKKKTDQCLSWNHSNNVGFCHHCNKKFAEFKEYQPKKEYSKPEWKNNTELSDNAIKYLEGRKISQFSIRNDNLLSEGLEWMPQEQKGVNTIQFNYFRNSELINVKYRDGKKNFRLAKDAELIFFNLDGIKENTTAIITEGEFDALSFIECGLNNVLSVPNGAAPNAKMEYLENCETELSKLDTIILAMDEDAIGSEFRDELARRLGKERCFKVSFKDCKDANDYLIKYGKDELLKVIENKEPYPIEGVFTVNDVRNELFNLYKQGMPKGMTIDDPIDDLISFDKGRLYTITGIPGHGKSEFIDFIIEKLSLKYNQRTAYFSPENYPLETHVSKLIEKIIGSQFKSDKMSMNEYNMAIEYLEDKYYWINPEENYSVDNILASAKSLVLRKGVNILVIDPYNKLEHNRKSNQSETEYISQFLDKILNFAHKYETIVFLIAHPRKMSKLATGIYEVPNLYDINGSSNFFNKTDFGVTVYRNMATDFVEVYIQKAKFKHLGTVGTKSYKYNINNGRYSCFNESDINDIKYDNSNHLTGLGNKSEPEPIITEATGLSMNMDFEEVEEMPF